MEKCLSSLRGVGVDRLYIVDNACQQEMKDYAGRHDAVYIPLPNPGYGAAHNAAIRMAIADGASLHLVLNSDVCFNPDELNRMVEFMHDNPHVGALHPLVLNPDGSRQYTARRLPTPLDLFGRRFLPERCMRKRNYRYLLKNANPSMPLDVPYFQGSFMLLRTRTLEKSGLFDERFFMYPEDIDLVRRMHELAPTLYWPHATVIHDHRAESYRDFKMLWIHIVNIIRYFNKWGWWHDPARKAANCHLDREVCRQSHSVGDFD